METNEANKCCEEDDLECTRSKSTFLRAYLARVSAQREGTSASTILANCFNGKTYGNCGLNVDHLRKIHCVLGGIDSRSKRREDLMSEISDMISSLNENETVYQNKADFDIDEYVNRTTPLNYWYMSLKSSVRSVVQYLGFTGEESKVYKEPAQWEVLAGTDTELLLPCDKTMYQYMAQKRLHTYAGREEKGMQRCTYKNLVEYYGKQKGKLIWPTLEPAPEFSRGREAASIVNLLKKALSLELYGLNFHKVCVGVEPISQDTFEKYFTVLTKINESEKTWLQTLLDWTGGQGNILKEIRQHVVKFYEKLDAYETNLYKSKVQHDSDLLMAQEDLNASTLQEFEVYPANVTLSKNDIEFNCLRYVRKALDCVVASNLYQKIAVDGENFGSPNGWFIPDEFHNKRELMRTAWKEKSNGMLRTEFVPLADIYLSHGLHDERFVEAQYQNLARAISLKSLGEQVVARLEDLKVGEFYFLSQD